MKQFLKYREFPWKYSTCRQQREEIPVGAGIPLARARAVFFSARETKERNIKNVSNTN